MANAGRLLLAVAVCIAQISFVHPMHDHPGDAHRKAEEDRMRNLLHSAHERTNPESNVLHPPSNVIQFYHTTPAPLPSDHLLPPPAPAQLLKCAPGSFGKHPYLIDCGKYLKCWNGHTEIMSCRTGMLFNAESKLCETAARVNCQNMFQSHNNANYRVYPTQPTKPVQENNLHKSSRLIDLGSSNRRPYERQELDVQEFGEIRCYGSHGLEPHPSDCSLFLNCVNGHGMVQQCGPGTVYNPDVKVCDWPYNVDCGRRDQVTYGEDLIDARFGGSKADSDNYVQPTISAARLRAIKNYALEVKPLNGKDNTNTPTNRQPKISNVFAPYPSTYHQQFNGDTNGRESEGHPTAPSRFGQNPERFEGRFGRNEHDQEDEGQHTFSSSFDQFPSGTSIVNQLGQTNSGPANDQQTLPSRFDSFPFTPQGVDYIRRHHQEEVEGQQTLSVDFNQYPSDGHSGYNKFGHHGVNGKPTVASDLAHSSHYPIGDENHFGNIGHNNKDEGQRIIPLGFDQFSQNANKFGTNSKTDLDTQQALASDFQNVPPSRGQISQPPNRGGHYIVKTDNNNQFESQLYTSQRYNQLRKPTTTTRPPTTTTSEPEVPVVAPKISAFDQEYQRGLENRINQKLNIHTTQASTTPSPESSYVHHKPQGKDQLNSQYNNQPIYQNHDQNFAVEIEKVEDGKHWGFRTFTTTNDHSHPRQYLSADQLQEEAARRSYADVRQANTFASSPHHHRNPQPSTTNEFHEDPQRTLSFNDQLLGFNEEGNQRRTVPNSLSSKPTNPTYSFVAPLESNADQTRHTTYSDPPHDSFTVNDNDLAESLRILDSYSKPERFNTGVHITPIYSRTRMNDYKDSQAGVSTTPQTLMSENPHGLTADILNEALQRMLKPYTKGSGPDNSLPDHPSVTTDQPSAVEPSEVRILEAESASQTRGSEKSNNRNDLDLTLDKFDRKKHGSPIFSTKNHQTIVPTSTENSDVELIVSEEETCEFDCMKDGFCVAHNKVCNGVNDCGNFLDEQHCPDVKYQIRLLNSSDTKNNSHSGILQVQVNSRWGHVCESQFGMTEAHVACKELGFHLGALEMTIGLNETQSADEVPFQMDTVNCEGHETSLKQCNHMGWGQHSNCTSVRAIGLVCKVPPIMKCLPNYWLCETSAECLPVSFLCDGVRDCNDSSDENEERCRQPVEFRLSGEPTGNTAEGRVEIRHHGVWGTVCDDDFTEREANVFCKSIGFDGPSIVRLLTNSTKTDVGPVWLDQVKCVGNESSINDCQHGEFGEHNCDHNEDVVVKCTTAASKFVWKPRSLDTTGLKQRKIPNQQTDHVVTNNLPEECGQIQVKDDMDFDYDTREGPVYRIHAGKSARRGHHPWQATIRVKGINGKSAHSCGATILTKMHVITAAHCLNFPHPAYVVRVGDHYRDEPDAFEREVFIETWHIHEQFRRGHISNNDIAVIQLKQPLEFNEYVQPICLPAANAAYVSGRQCSISGWGSTKVGKSNAAFELQAASLPIISDEICKQDKVYGKNVTEGMFCAGFLDSNSIDACEGDSGGPLVCEEEDVHRLYGIISWGHRCGEKNKPGVYVKIAKYVAWIHNIIATTTF